MHCSKQSENLISKSDRSGRGMKYAVLNGALFRSASFHPKWALSRSNAVLWAYYTGFVKQAGYTDEFLTLWDLSRDQRVLKIIPPRRILIFIAYRFPRVSFRVIYDPLKNCAKIQSNSNSSPFVSRKYSFLVFQAYFKNVSLKIARITVR